MKTVLYRLEQVVKQYQGRTVLSVDQMELRQGEIFGLVGPSGAGKSTLLRLLNFLEQPNRGTITFEGYALDPIQNPPLPLRRKVTTVFQHPAMLDRSVLDNVGYGLRIRQISNWKQRAQQTIAQVGLSHLTEARTRNLSGGEIQRVALARALVLEPEVLLLDEPTANLDPRNVALIEDIVTSSHTKNGLTVLIVTHNIFQAQRLAERVGFILEGELIEVADREVFFNHPSDPRTAAFTRGEMVY
jgi:tungstate transport system ATP-binding protein